ncbi:MAG TPA: hypothetical protein PLK12_15220 [Prolixibacteraceae bacterium]|nr:hypothetical protein [Prolixibacteraceae bacterium]
MELDDLKQTWNKLASNSQNRGLLPEEEIRRYCERKTLDISEKIGRNIRIGVGIIVGWVSLGFAINFLFSPMLENYLDKPYITDELLFWTFLVEVFNYLLIFVTILVFWLRYNAVERNNPEAPDLRDKLQRLIRILGSYKVMFYVVLVIVLLYVIASFSSGFIMASSYELEEAGIKVDDIRFFRWIVVGLTFLIVLGIIVGIYYLLFNFFFKRLYGRYLKQLKATLHELDESIPGE